MLCPKNMVLHRHLHFLLVSKPIINALYPKAPFWIVLKTFHTLRVKNKLKFFSCLEFEDIHMYLDSKFHSDWMMYMVAAQK